MLLPNLCLGSERENQITPTRGRKNSHVWEKVFPHVPPPSPRLGEELYFGYR